MLAKEFTITGMTCGHCEGAVRAEVSQIAGVEGVDVSFDTGKLTVTFGLPIDDQLILNAVDEAGYQAVRA